MDLDFNPDQQLLAEALGKWASGHRDIAADQRTSSFLDGRSLVNELKNQGFLDAARVPELGLLGAVLLVEAACRVPAAIEIAGSGLVAPALDIAVAGPLALMRADGNKVGRFLMSGGNALVDCGDHIRLIAATDAVEAVDSPYAYPFGRYVGDLLSDGAKLEHIAVVRFRQLSAIAVAAEALAAMEAALALTVEHVTIRVQFGRPIGSFQALQHRLADCSAQVHALRWLLYRAACENNEAQSAGTAGEAAIVAHDATRRVIYETTQFHGALGLTLEYPLHLWTYRLRVLQSELARAAAEASR